MASIDLKDAYFLLPITDKHKRFDQKYLNSYFTLTQSVLSINSIRLPQIGSLPYRPKLTNQV